MPDQARIVCVSNRLPVNAKESSGALEFQPSSGGLVTAMAPVLRETRGLWLGWTGASATPEEEVRRAVAAFSADSYFDLAPVILDARLESGFYQGFSNQIAWPLFHDLQSRCNFDPSFWAAYLEVQRVFADEIERRAQPADLIWIHDFHLMGVGRELVRRNIGNKLCFFLHTPFPAHDIFAKLPWCADVIDSLLNHDLIGFQTRRDLKNFVDCIKEIAGVEAVPRGDGFSIRAGGKERFAGAFPISIDFREFEEASQSAEVESNAQRIRADMNAEFLFLSIDRLDYTKGVPYRIRAYRRLLERRTDLKKRIALLQVLVPSRVEVPEYKLLRSEIDNLVAQVNGEMGEPGWMPVHHLFRNLSREEVLAMYRASDAALVTPLKDGMNLVAKEYCASRINNGGALVLSEFAGAANEFRDSAFLVNPYDVDGVTSAMEAAISMSPEDGRVRMQSMRESIRRADVYVWASKYLSAVGWEWRSRADRPRPSTLWDRVRRMANVFEV